MKAINVLLALLVSLLIALGVFEGGLRLLRMGPPKTINEFDEALGWSKRPGAVLNRATNEYDVTLEINDLGLREDAMSSAAKPKDTFRVLCLGDSFTLGYTVERRDLFVDQLEMKWEAEGRKVDVVNAGTEGYSTDQEVVWLLENGDAYQPDLVLLFPYDNDFYWNGQKDYFGKQKPRFDQAGRLDHQGPFTAPAEKGFFESLAIWHLAQLLGGAAPQGHTYRPEGGSRELLSEFSSILLPPPGFLTDAVLRTEGALIALKQKCDELGARLVVAPIPSHAVLEPAFGETFATTRLGLESLDNFHPEGPILTMLELCSRNDIDALDARQALKAAIESTGESMHYAVDWHLSPTGNRHFAEFLDAGLVAGGAFPAEHAAATETDFDVVFAGLDQRPRMPGWIRWYIGIWIALTTLYYLTYRDEPAWQPPLKCGAMLGVVFSIVIGGTKLLALAPPKVAQGILILFIVGILGFVVFKLGRRVSTILELLKAFTLRGHWYLMPLVTILLTIGSLLVVAASSPLVAPFIYTLF